MNGGSEEDVRWLTSIDSKVYQVLLAGDENGRRREGAPMKW